MPKITKRGAGYSFRYYDENGVRRRAPTFDRHGDAKAFMATTLARVERAKAGAGPKPILRARFDDVAREFLEDAEANPERRTTEGMRSRIGTARSSKGGRVRRYFGPRWTDEITTRDLTAFRRWLTEEGLSPQSVVHHLNAASAVLKFAVDRGHLRRCPTMPKRPKIPKPGFTYLREPEIPRFLATAREIGAAIGARYDDDGWGLELLYRTAIGTGLRKGELACLRWTDVDFEREIVTVRASFNGPPKNGETREVPLTLDADLFAELQKWSAQGPRSDWVFPARSGQRLDRMARPFQEYFARVRDAAEIPTRMVRGQNKQLTLHSLRHTFGTRYMAKGGSLWRLRDYMGHQSIETTQRYAHRDAQAAEKDRGLFST